MSFAWVSDVGERLARFFQSGCELLRLLRGNLGVLLAVQAQQRRLDIVDVRKRVSQVPSDHREQYLPSL